MLCLSGSKADSERSKLQSSWILKVRPDFVTQNPQSPANQVQKRHVSPDLHHPVPFQHLGMRALQPLWHPGMRHRIRSTNDGLGVARCFPVPQDLDVPRPDEVAVTVDLHNSIVFGVLGCGCAVCLSISSDQKASCQARRCVPTYLKSMEAHNKMQLSWVYQLNGTAQRFP
jgi:hypothetical protein